MKYTKTFQFITFCTQLQRVQIRLNKRDGFIKIDNKIRYLVLLDYSYCDKISDKIKYLISEQSGITDSINHKFARIIIDAYDSLPNEKILIFHNMMKLITLAINKNKNEYYHKIFLEEDSHKGKSDT